jgi:sialate O-acetylesterase
MKNVTLLACLILSTQALGEIKLPSLIGDHMVLQQGMKAHLWGWASENEKITVTFNRQKVETQAGKDGTWSVYLKPMKAGGPYDLTLSGKNTLVVKDVLVGEVWVGSGQSNMAMCVCDVRDSAKEIAEAKFPDIRLFSVTCASSLKPCDNVNGTWQVCTPETVKYFSATAYFFGRQLHKDLNVPVGLINSSVGGTAIESWISLSGILKMNDLSIARACKKTAAEVKVAQAEYEKEKIVWDSAAFTKDPGNKGFGQGWAEPSHSTADWKTMTLPQPWEKEDDMDIDGVVWFRRDVEIPPDWAGKDLTVKFGPIDDCDTTYLNNTQIGATGMETPNSWSIPRKYTIPGKWVKAGRSVIAVRVFDRWMTGGFMGSKGDMTLALASGKGKVIDLSGPWFYKVEFGVTPKSIPSPPVAPYLAGSPSCPGQLYNAMIHPLTSFAIRGVIWYQGESNSLDARAYQSLLPAMIREWRNQWGQGDFPFLIVQLANFMATFFNPSDTPLARLREAQLLTVKRVPNTALAVAIDIGDASDIHPKNKQEVGRRLALAGERITYGKKIPFSGPIYNSMKIKGNKIRLKFDHTDGGLMARGDNLTGFAIAGADKKFVWAQAKIEGDKVFVWSDKVSKPVAVRYGWADNPVCNLFNKAGLPASPFRTDDF